MNKITRKLYKSGLFIILGGMAFAVNKWWYNVCIVIGATFIMYELDKGLENKKREEIDK